MLRYLIIPLIFVSLLTSCETEPQTVVPHQTSIQDGDMLSGVTLHGQTFPRYPMNLYELNPEKRAEVEQSYRASLQKLDTEYRKYENTIPEGHGKITYREAPESMSNLGFFNTGELVGDFSGIYGEQTGSYLHVADIAMSDGTVAQLISVRVYGFMMNPASLYFVEQGGQYFFIPSISYGINEVGSGETSTIERIAFAEKQLVKGDIHLFDEKRFAKIFASDFSIPEKVSLSQSGKVYTLDFKKREAVLFSQKNLRRLDALSEQLGKDVYIEKSGDKEWLSPKSQEIAKIWSSEESQKLWESLSEDDKETYNQERFQMGMFSSDAIFVELPDHTVALYTLEVPFEITENTDIGPEVHLQRNDGSMMVFQSYGYQDSQSCGIKDGTFFNIPDGKFRFEEMYILDKRIRDNPKVWKDKLPADITPSETIFTYEESDLTEIGTTESGESLLYFKDQNHPFLKAMYDYGYLGQFDWQGCPDGITGSTCGTPLTYETYVRSIPLFFWRDPFGRLIMFISYNTIMPSACAAKPVIYLYPEQIENVSVTLDWQKKSLTSIPDYGNGWDVTATPESKITTAGKTYPYLFWEDSINYPKPTSGFIVAQSELSSFLDTKLEFLGLNQQEITDFKGYWLPVMQGSPYYRISFLTNEQMEKSAPITITPKPDTLQRVFMDWSALESPISLPEQKLVPFVRSGFSAIEWGGRKY